MERTDAELHDWALARYGSEEIAGQIEIVRQLFEDVQTIERRGDLPADDEIPYDDFMADLNERLRRAGHPTLPLSAARRPAV